MDRNFRSGGERDDGLQVLWEDGEHVFGKGRVRADGNWIDVLAVQPAAEHPSPASFDRLTHEYELRDELDGIGAVRPLQLIRDRGRTMLVLEDFGGEPLERLLGPPLELEAFLRLAIGVAGALAKVHHRRIVHKDIKPTKILVNRVSGEVRLTGFGIASRLPRERQTLEPPETIAGTLAYMAPEQTGRMNRSIDSRSDLYSLGVTFYQMLTGVLPFTASDPMEWVHCHIARRPVPPSERLDNVPAPVSRIIMKLLAKIAEERYQTAAGVERDLRRCLADWEERHRIDDFPLAEHDAPDRLFIPEKLYGRAHEVDALLAAFDRVVAGGAAELVLVSGYSGIGKSSVVNELHKMLVPPRGLFASGKLDQYKRDIPYSTLAQAFQSLVRALLGKSDAELAGWRDAFLETLGPNGRLIVDLVPELKLIIGDQPPVPELPPQQAQGRFQLVFQRFLGVFATPEHPLALFLDDLQWLDVATLDLLEHLLTRSDLRYLLLVGAYRDNEVDAAHPLARKLDAIRQAGAAVREIHLPPLAGNDLTQLIADTLRCEPGRAVPLAQLVHAKTAGNPFFVIRFLYALAEEGLLAFDYDVARWTWDLQRIHAKGYTDNVVELMVGKLTRLPKETQNALQQLACLGNVAEITMLSIVLGTSEEQGHAVLWEAARLELVERVAGAYRFAHDRVQEAAYSLIPEASLAAAHLRIGRLLVARTPPERREAAVFEIVNQLNRGAALITSQDEREQLAELNLIAGKRAKASTAYASALTYLTAGAALLVEDCWDRRHELVFSLELLLAECEFLTSALADAEQRLNALSTRAANTSEHAAVACLRLDLYTTLGQGERAVDVGLDYLRQLGVNWSPHPTEEQARLEYERIWSQLGGRAIEELLDLPLMSDPASLATLGVLIKLETPAVFTDLNLLTLTICRAVNLSLERGNSDGSSIAYVRLGTLAGARFGNYKAGYRFGRLGYDLVEQRGLQRFRARTYMTFAAHVLPWTRHVRDARDSLRGAFEAANKVGDITFAAYNCAQLNTHLLVAGDPLADVQREAENGLRYTQKLQFGVVFDLIIAQLKLIQTLRGLTPRFGRFDDERFEEARFERKLSSNSAWALTECRYWIGKQQARFFAGDYAAAIDASSKAERLLWTSPSRLEVADYHFYGALSRAAAYDCSAVDLRELHLEALQAHQQQLEVWAENCLENFENRAALVGAEIARLEGRDGDAMRLYEQAIRSAHDNGFVHNEAIADECASRFYRARGVEQIADLYIRHARDAYIRWGADGKVRQLEQICPQLRTEAPKPAPTSTIGAPVEHLDLAAVIKVLQAVSGEMVLEKLIDTLMRAAIQYAGAERGLLILPGGKTERVAAEAAIADDIVDVRIMEAPVAEATLAASIVHYVVRMREPVVLDDASAENPFSADPYIRQRHLRSVLCLPLVTQNKLAGVLYLENNLAPRVFTPSRIVVLQMLASQAAISVENTRLYHDLEERESKIRRLIEANIIGITFWNLEGEITDANDAFLRMVGYTREDLLGGRVRWTDLSPPDWRARHAERLAQFKITGAIQPWEREYFRKDGSRVLVLAGSAAFGERRDQGVSFVLDLTERKRVEQALRNSEERFRTLMQFSFDVYWETDAEHRIIRQKFEATLADAPAPGYEIGKTRWEVPYLEPDEEAWRRHRETLEARLPFRDFELARPMPDGGKRYVSVSGLPVFDDGGRFIGYRGVGRDITERKRAEQALRISEERFRTLMQFSSDIYWETDAEHRITRQEFQTGHAGAPTPGSEIGKRRWEVPYLEPDAEAWRKHRETLDAHLPFRDFELARPTSDGAKRYWSNSGLPVFDDGGRFIGYRGVGRYITARKRAEQALRDSEEQWRAVFENNPTMYFMIDAAGTIVSVNPFGAEQLGYTTDELVGRPAVDLFHEADRAAVERNAATCFQHLGRTMSWELRKLHKDGTLIWVRETARAMTIKQRPILLIVCEDISERKQAEHLTQQWFESSPNALAIIGRDYRYQRVNPFYERYWGIPAERIVGRHAAEFRGWEVFERSIKVRLDRCFAADAQEPRYTGWMDLRIGRRYFMVTYTPLRPRSDEVEAALVIHNDITEYELASEALREAQAELAHMNRVTTMGQLTATIAHEVNQPIAAAVTNASAALRWLSAPSPDLAEARQALARILENGNRAGDVIGRIRALIKKAPPRNDGVAINDAILEVIALTHGEAMKTGVSVRTQLAGGLPAIEGDRVQLQQVILNLVINAIEAMSGVLEAPRELLLSTEKHEPDAVHVAVRDSGPGMAPEALEQLFDAFYTTKPSGLGLGLSICRSIVESHGGRLWASANTPRGAIFEFTLPAPPDRES